MSFTTSWRRRPMRAATIAVFLFGMTAAPAAHAAQPYAVTIQSFTFGPAALTVPLGATVTWINQDDSPHTVTTDDRRIKSPALDTGDKFSFTFDKPGSYTYFCTIHPHMTGMIVVRPPPSRSSAR